MKTIVLRYHRVLFWGLILFFTAICLSSVWKDSFTYDEIKHLMFGANTLFGHSDHAWRQRMPVTALNALPIVIIQKTNIPIVGQTLIWLCRIPTIVFRILLGIFIFRWSRQLYGFQGGLFSLFLYAFCPNIIAHTRLATNDVYCCFFIFISVYAFKKYAGQKTPINFIFLSVAVGMAQLTKQTALLLFPILFLLGIMEFFPHSINFRFYLKKRFWCHSLLFVFIVMLIINLGYAFKGSFSSLHDYREWFQSEASSESPDVAATLPPIRDGVIATCLDTVPIPLPRAYVEALILGKYFNATGLGHGPTYLLGKVSQYGHWYYFLVAFILKTPLSIIALLVLAIWMTIKSRQSPATSDETSLLVTAGIIFLFFSFCTTAQIGIRYILPMYPFLYVFLGKIVAKETTRLKSRMVVILSVYLVVSSLSYYPHYISYFNELCWNRTKLYKYLADSNLDWGQNNYYLADYVMLHHDENIHVNPTQPISGKIIVDANKLVGIDSEGDPYKWLRDGYEPVGNIAYTWIYYEIPDK